MNQEDLLQTVLYEKRVQNLVTEDGKLWNAIIEFATRWHEQQVNSVDLADVVLSEERAELCKHRWEDVDNFSDRRICEKCGKIN